MAGASSLLMIRAIALWGRDLKVVIPLGILHVVQWAINLHNGFFAKEHWDDATQGCVFTNVTWPWMKVQFIFSE